MWAGGRISKRGFPCGLVRGGVINLHCACALRGNTVGDARVRWWNREVVAIEDVGRQVRGRIVLEI